MDTLTQIWTTYKGDVIPALVSALIAFIPFFVFWIKARMNLSTKKQEAQLEVMKQIANKEDTTPQIESLTSEVVKLEELIKEVKESNSNMAVLFNEAFQGSDLSPEIKSALESLKNKVVIGSNQDIIAELEAQLARVKEEYLVLLESTKNKVESVIVEEVAPAANKIKKIRR